MSPRPDLGPKPLLGYTANHLARVAERRGDAAFIAAQQIDKSLYQSLRVACKGSFVLETDSAFFRPFDFAREGLNEGFKFNNPNVKDACGCGESFNV